MHLRIASPPVTNPCYYGIDTPVRKELIASSHTVDEIKTYLRVDSLAYLSLSGLLEAAGDGGSYCEACFSGNYPVSFAEEAGKDVFDNQRAFRAGVGCDLAHGFFESSTHHIPTHGLITYQL